jgi:hypothetical protein
VVPEADAIVRATDFFKPAWQVPEARASAAEEESQRRPTLENGRLDGEG